MAGGFVQKSEEIKNRIQQLPKKDDQYQPQQLTMKHLGVCFAVISIGWVKSFVVFVIEYSIKFFKMDS